MATRFVFGPLSAELPVDGGAFPALRRDAQSRPILLFANGVAPSAMWTAQAPQGMTGALTLALSFYSAVTSGDVRWVVGIEAIGAGDAVDLDSEESFAASTAFDAAVNATQGRLAQCAITLSDIDGISPGDYFRITVSRAADDSADTAEGDVMLLSVELRDSATSTASDDPVSWDYLEDRPSKLTELAALSATDSLLWFRSDGVLDFISVGAGLEFVSFNPPGPDPFSGSIQIDTAANFSWSGTHTFATQSPGDNSTKPATTEFVTEAVAAAGGGGGAIDGIVIDATTSRTLALTDKNKRIVMTDSTVFGDIPVTVPPNSDIPFAVGDRIEVERGGTARASIVAGSGVTLRAARGLHIGIRYGVAVLTKIDTDVWTVTGEHLTNLTINGSAPDDVESTPYVGFAYTVAGGVGTKTSAITAGAQPTGVSYSTSSHALGTEVCSADGAFSWSITVTDALGAQAYISDAVTITNAPLFAVWDSTKLQTGNALSNGDRTMTAAGTQQYSIATIPKSAGKWVWRIGGGGSTFNTDNGGGGFIVGVAGGITPGAWPNSNSYLGNGGSPAAEQVGFWMNGTIYRTLTGGSGSGSSSHAGYTPSSDVLEFRLDLNSATNTLAIYKQTGGTGSFVLITTVNLPSGKTWNAAYALWSSGAKVTIDSGQSGFTEPAGFSHLAS